MALGSGNNRGGLPRAGGGDETVFVSAKTWDRVMDRLEELEGLFSPEDFDVKQGKDGKQVRLRGKSAGAVSSSGPFCKVYKDGSDWKLLGGAVTGGEGNETVSDINIGSVASPPADGTFYWLKIDFDAEEEDDVLLPGGEVTGVTTGSGSSLPDNSVPTASNTSGYLYVSMGQWQGGVFNPSNCGDIHVKHCPGSLTPERI